MVDLGRAVVVANITRSCLLHPTVCTPASRTSHLCLAPSSRLTKVGPSLISAQSAWGWLDRVRATPAAACSQVSERHILTLKCLFRCPVASYWLGLPVLGSGNIASMASIRSSAILAGSAAGFHLLPHLTISMPFSVRYSRAPLT